MAYTNEELQAMYDNRDATQKLRAQNAIQPADGGSPLGDEYAQGLMSTYTSERGGGDQHQKLTAIRHFKEIFNRNPSQTELGMLSGAYAGDPNSTNDAQGRSAIAQYYQTLTNSPDQINKRNQDQYLKDAPQHYDSINQMFQSTLGRVASQEELDHFGKELASGSTDSYGLSQFLKQQPEYTDKQDQSKQDKIKQEQLTLQEQMKADNQAFQTDAQGKIKGFVGEAEAKNKAYQEDLSGKLAGYDQQYFGEQILPTIQQNFAKQGRSFDSSGFQNSATQSAQQQNIARQQYLASLSSDQYAQLQQHEGAMQAGLQGISAGQYGNLQGQQAAQQAFVNNLSASQYGARQDQAYNEYAQALANQQNMTNSSIQSQYQGMNNLQSRVNDISDYATQANSYNQYLAKFGKRGGGAQGAMAGASSGAALGTAVNPGWGTAIGGVVGGAAGYFSSRGSY